MSNGRTSLIASLVMTTLLLIPAASFAEVECTSSPIEVVGSSASGNTLDVTLGNPQPTSIDAWLLGTIQAGGRSFQFTALVTLDGNSTETVVITFQGTIIVVGELTTCGDLPQGVSETPDPIIVEATKKNH